MQCSVHGENIVVFCMHIGVLVVSRYHTSLQQTLRRYSHSHSLTLSLTSSLTNSFTHSLTLSLPRSLSHSLTHSLTHSDSQTRKLPDSPAAHSTVIHFRSTCSALCTVTILLALYAHWCLSRFAIPREPAAKPPSILTLSLTHF